ncbi:MAG: YaaA family protein [Porphyromonadaceae bacterium]|nr:YaaA family protein [Porphyromonadaceae bacterium]
MEAVTMQILMSPAKLMSFPEKKDRFVTTKPSFPDKTKELISVCQQLSEKEIETIMKINPKMARNVYEQFQTFYFNSTPKRAAALAYNGIAYAGLNAHDFSDDDVAFAQRHLNILSGLYGVLRPFDLIRPYRLEMQRQIVPPGYRTLYEFWQETVIKHLAARFKKEDKTIINVASSEYAKVIRKNALRAGIRIIDIRFLQLEHNDFKQIVVHTKKARGLMARYIIKNRLTDAEDVKGFHYEEYFYHPALSKENEWVFVK